MRSAYCLLQRQCHLGLLALLFVLCGTKRSLADASLTPFVIPIQINYGHILFTGTLNGKPARFLLDTGATATLLSQKAAQLFEVPVAKESEVAQAAGGAIVMWKAGPITIGFGKLLLKIDDTYVGPEFEAQEDATLGFAFLHHFVVTIDYEHHCMGVGKDAHGTIAAVRDFVEAQYHGLGKTRSHENFGQETLLSIKLDDADIPSIPGSVDGHPVRLDIDSGDGGSLTLFAPYVNRHRLRKQFEYRIRTTTGKGLGGSISGDVVRVSTLTLGRGKQSARKSPILHGVVTELPEQNKGAFANAEVSGQIGTKILDRFVVTFDYPHKQMLLTPNSHRDDPFVFSRTGYGTDKQGGRYIAVAVLPGSPAALAGIRNGDVIVSVDGVPIRTIMEKQDDLYFHQPIGTVRRVVYKRGSQKPVEVKLTLRELLP